MPVPNDTAYQPAVASWQEAVNAHPKFWAVEKLVFLSQNSRPKMQSWGWKTAIFRKIRGKSKFWAPIISSVGKLQLPVPPTFLAHDAAGNHVCYNNVKVFYKSKYILACFTCLESVLNLRKQSHMNKTAIQCAVPNQKRLVMWVPWMYWNYRSDMTDVDNRFQHF